MEPAFQNKFLKDKVRNLTESPGCYLWKNAEGVVIYIGKAIRLADRVKSYLNPNQSDIKTQFLQQEIQDFEWIATDSELEALILEATLIKKHNPKYNVRLKDDKKYPYICVSTGEPFPMVFLTRKIRDDGNRYFGPFTDVKSTRDTLTILHKIFPVRKTPLKLPLLKPQKPCLNFHINRCIGPCRGTISVEEYSEVVKQILKFLDGKKDDLVFDLRTRMESHSEKMEYELAIRFRNMLENVDRFRRNQVVVGNPDEDGDVIAFAKREDDGQVVIFEVRSGRLEAKKTFAIQGMAHSSDKEVLTAFLRDYYLTVSFIPKNIILPGNIKNETAVILDHIERTTGVRPKISFPGGGEKRGLLRLAEKNAEMNLTERILATKFRDQSVALKELKENLKLDDIPNVIECYDISHFQGTEPVASGVMFVEGKPYKAGYRHYRMRGYSGINDPGMIHEVIGRRLQRLLNEDESLPDLIVIDGGPTQLARACEAAMALDLRNIPIISLAKKREEIFFPGESTPYIFDINSPSMRLLRHIRDEAHRFGVTFHRERRNRETLKTILNEIPDVGKERRKAILSYFADKKKIEDADVPELMQVPGIGERLANAIYDTIHKKSIPMQ
ncbi:MAG: excinuclease ABC subunit UvrC [Leptospira sp.]|nr:excinuclease ABC subunit UvrC [Leptospira sp.]